MPLSIILSLSLPFTLYSVHSLCIFSLHVSRVSPKCSLSLSFVFFLCFPSSFHFAFLCLLSIYFKYISFPPPLCPPPPFPPPPHLSLSSSIFPSLSPSLFLSLSLISQI